jgi:hypothetical protein
VVAGFFREQAVQIAYRAGCRQAGQHHHAAVGDVSPSLAFVPALFIDDVVELVGQLQNLAVEMAGLRGTPSPRLRPTA